jgi:hypothetical protein
VIGTPVVWLVLLVVAVGGFCVGWAGRGDTNRARQDSADRYHAGQLAAELDACRQELARVSAVQPPTPGAAPAVVHVHLAMPALYQGWAQPVVEGQIVRELEGRS